MSGDLQMGMSSRICPQCGNALALDELNCHICGSRYVDQAGIELTPRTATANLGRINTSMSTVGQAQYAFSPATPYGNAANQSAEQGSGALPTDGHIAPTSQEVD